MSGVGADEESFGEVFDALFLRCGRLAYRLLGDRAAAEDVAAEAMARAYAHWSRIARLEYRDAWVLRVATNLAVDRGRRRRWQARWPGSPVDERPHVQPELELAALRVTLVAALGQLPRRQREVVVLRHLSGLSEPEVAAATGLALGTVKTHLRRGLAGLRASLGEDFGRSGLAV